MVEELKRIALSDEYEDVLDIDCKNGFGRTAMNIAVKNKKYFMIKILFNEKANNAPIIDEMIKACLTSKDEFDETDQSNCQNFKFYKKLLDTRKGIYGNSIMEKCLETQRVDYFEALLAVNHKLDSPFTCGNVWYWVCLRFYVCCFDLGLVCGSCDFDCDY